MEVGGERMGLPGWVQVVVNQIGWVQLDLRVVAMAAAAASGEKGIPVKQYGATTGQLSRLTARVPPLH